MTVAVGSMTGERVLFTQTDPLQGDPDKGYESAYVYAYNSPLKFTDPSGKRGSEPQPQRLEQYIGKKDWGRFDVRAFISTAKVGGWSWFPGSSKGDGRSFSSSATCAESRACLDFDFNSGRVYAEVNASHDTDGNAKAPQADQNKLELTDYGSTVKLRFSLVNPLAPRAAGSVWERKMPAISGTWTFRETAGPQIGAPGFTPQKDSVQVSFNGDSFPSWEVWQRRAGQSPWPVMMLRESSPKAGLPGGLFPIWPNKSASAVVRKQQP